MINENFNLISLGGFIGILLIFAHTIGLLFFDRVIPFLRSFARSTQWGNVLFILSILLILLGENTLDLGEFSPLRGKIILATCILGILFRFLVEDFLAPRSFGLLLLIIPQIVLKITFLQMGYLKIGIVFLTYFWIIVGLLLVGRPCYWRDSIDFLSYHPIVYRLLSFLGIFYGICLLGMSVLDFIGLHATL